jgi:Nucleoside-diphosphate-sugar epimerases
MELAELIKKLTGSTAEIISRPLPIDDPKRRLPDITKAQKLIEWKPSKDLVEGLTETINWYRKELENKKEKASV